MPVNNNIFFVKWNKLVSWLVPAALCKAKMYAMAKSLVHPVSQVHSFFTRFRKQNLYELSINGQVCKLQKLLNDEYDSVLRRIYIVDGEPAKRKYVFTTGEFVPLPIYTDDELKPTYIYQDGEITVPTVHFIIKIPFGLSYNSDEFISLLNTFKLPSKKFTIQTF